MNPTISQIRIYPVKSLDPVSLTEAEVGFHCLKHDREFAMLADDGRFVNGKRTGQVNLLKAAYDLEGQIIRLSHRDGTAIGEFHLLRQSKELEKTLGDFFGYRVHLLHRTKGELMDIPDVSSVTILGEGSLQSLHQSFPHLDFENLRLRFRATIEISGVPAYWEENLFGQPGTGIQFQAGEVTMIGISPRARCNVPPRDPMTGEPDKTFIKTMMKSRSATLPTDSLLPVYGSLYQLSVNVYLPESEQGKFLRKGDEIRITGPVALEESEA